MSSSMVMASDHTTSLNLGVDLQTTKNDPHHQTAARKSSSNSSTRRKTSKANEGCKKKQPQRGMGVAQLERLRLQERWKKITQINPTSTPPLLSTALDTSVFAEPKPTNIGPVQFSRFCGFGTGGVNGVGLNLMQQGFVVQKEGNGGSLLFHGQGMVSDDVCQGYLYGIGNMNGNSKELSSTPKFVKCYTDHCTDCHKKKRTFTRENLMFNEVNMYPNLPVAGCDFNGLNAGSSGQNVKGGNRDPEKKATFLHSGTSELGFCYTDQGVVEVALEKKGSSGSSGVPNALMEYEFFPGKGGCRSNGSSHNELLMMKKSMGNSESSAVMGGEASRFATATSTTPTGGASVDASTSIDLSLRLSY